jgi:hypothetical protein
MSISRDPVSSYPIPFDDVEVLLRYDHVQTVCALISNHSDYVIKIFTSQKEVAGLEEEKLVTTFFNEYSEQILSTIGEILQRHQITPSKNIMLAIANRMMDYELTGKEPRVALKVIYLFESLYSNKSVFREILLTPLFSGHHIYTFIAQSGNLEILQQLTRKFDIDVNTPNIAYDEEEVSSYSTQRRTSTVARVVEALILSHMYETNKNSNDWNKNLCAVIKFLVLKNANIDELKEVYTYRKNQVEQSDERNNFLPSFIVACRNAFTAVSEALAIKSPQLVSVSSSANSMFGEQSGLQVGSILKELDEMEKAYNQKLESEDAEMLSHKSNDWIPRTSRGTTNRLG